MSVRTSGESFYAGGAGGPATELAAGCTGVDLTLTGALEVQGDMESRRDVSLAGTQDIAAATDTIGAGRSLLRVTNTTGALVTMTSTPTISTTGVADGTVVILENVTDPGQTIVLQDLSVLAGSKLRLAAGTNKSLSGRDMIGFQYNAAADEWRQVVGLAAL